MRRIGLWTVTLAMIAALLPVSMASGQSDGPPELITAAPGARALTDTTTGVARARAVDLNTDALFLANGDARTARDLPRVGLEMFDDASFTGTITDVGASELGWSWTGDLEGIEGGYFYIAEADGTLAIHVASSDGIYEVRSTTNGGYKAVEIDQSEFVDHPPGEYIPPVLDEQPSADAQGRAAGRTIDVMVLYTPAARVAAGGTNAMKALIALAMTETKDGYKRSNVTPRLRLVHIQEVSYVEYNGGSGVFDTTLNNLLNQANGLKIGNTLRNRYGADMVSMIIDNGEYCGLAAGIWPGAAYGYQVTAWNCATGYYSFGHEFGHLQGARHDWYMDSNTYPFYHGHGYVNAEDYWRTVMAYNDECFNLWSGRNCTRLNWWSNPQKSVPAAWGGDPVGNVNTKNYQVLNETASDVAGWRKSKIADNFNSSFKKNAKGWSNVIGTWARSKGAYQSSGVRNKAASAVHSGQYGDITFEALVKRTGKCKTCANRLILRGKSNKNTKTGSWKPSYEFAYTNNGQFSVWKVKPNGSLVAKKGWTSSTAIRPGKWNRLKVRVVGSRLTFYINGKKVWSGTDSQISIGQVGVGFYRDKRAGKMLVDWAKVTTTATADAAPDTAADIAYDESAEIEAAPGANNSN